MNIKYLFLGLLLLIPSKSSALCEEIITAAATSGICAISILICVTFAELQSKGNAKYNAHAKLEARTKYSNQNRTSLGDQLFVPCACCVAFSYCLAIGALILHTTGSC